MKKLFIYILNKHKEAYSRKWYFLSVLIGFILWLYSILFMFESGSYTESVPYTPALGDMIIDNIITLDFQWSVTYVIELSIKFTYFFSLVFLPVSLPFMLKSFAMFKIVRGVFVSLLHMGPPAAMLQVGFDPTVAVNHYLTKDLFFSGHVGYIFLSMFIFWHIKILRYLFLLATIVMTFMVFFMKFHYSIDAIAALPITFFIYFISKEIFKSDWLKLRDSNYKEPEFLSFSPYKKDDLRFDQNCL